MWLNIKFTIQFTYASIKKNLLKSLSIIISIIIITSTIVTMIGWIDEAPRKAISTAFDNRGYEIKISEIYYHEGGLESLSNYLQTEDIVEDTAIIHRSMLLFNLNNKRSNLSILNPPENESDFFISNDDLHDGVFFVPNDFFQTIKHMLEFEPNSELDFFDENNRSQVIISRRILTLIEEQTNQTVALGSEIPFSVASQFLPRNCEELQDLNPQMITYDNQNLTIGGIYDRIPSQTQLAFGLEFYHETIGDGIFVCNEIMPKTFYSEIEGQGFFPTLYIRLNRTYLQQLSIDKVTTEINHLSARIYQQGRFNLEIQIDEINSLLQSFMTSYIVITMILLPILILAEVFFLALVPHLINTRIEELRYLRLRGVSDQKIKLIKTFEFTFLLLIGTIVGLIGGKYFFDILISSNHFLQIPPGFHMQKEFQLDYQNSTIVIGVVLIAIFNVLYYIFLFQRLLKQLHDDKSGKSNTRILHSRHSLTQVFLRILLTTFFLYLVFIVAAPILLNEIGVSNVNFQLIPLLVILLMIVWVLFSFYIPQLSLYLIQSFLSNLRVFTNPKRGLTWMNLFRRRNQFISLLAIISLTVSIFTFTIVWETTTQKNSNQNADYTIGSDLKLVTNEVNVANFSSKLENFTFIEQSLGLPKRTVVISRYTITLIGINPENYSNIAPLYQQSIVEGSPAASFWHSLDENPLHSIIINDYLSEVFKWYVNKQVQATELLSGYGAEWNLTVKGILNSAPGIGSLFPKELEKGFDRNGGYAFVHNDLLKTFGSISANIFLIKFSSDEFNITSAINQLKELSDVRSIFTTSSIEHYQHDFFQLTGVQGILTIDAIGSMIIAILGVSVFYQYLLRERYKEFAIHQALGATRKSIVKLAFVESTFLVMLGIILGIISGNLFALGFLTLSRTATISPNNIFLLELTLSPEIFLIGLITTSFILIISMLIPIRKIFSLEITNLLREL